MLLDNIVISIQSTYSVISEISTNFAFANYHNLRSHIFQQLSHRLPHLVSHALFTEPVFCSLPIIVSYSVFTEGTQFTCILMRVSDTTF